VRRTSVRVGLPLPHEPMALGAAHALIALPRRTLRAPVRVEGLCTGCSKDHGAETSSPAARRSSRDLTSLKAWLNQNRLAPAHAFKKLRLRRRWRQYEPVRLLNRESIRAHNTTTLHPRTDGIVTPRCDTPTVASRLRAAASRPRACRRRLDSRSRAGPQARSPGRPSPAARARSDRHRLCHRRAPRCAAARPPRTP
jgi:hypothetical protein